MDAWIENLLNEMGVGGVALLMFVENLLPPIPSEIVMPWAGYAVSQGEMSFLAAVLAGSAGSFLGAAFWYFIARYVGAESLRRWIDRHGWWLTLDQRDVDQTIRWFDRWGGPAVLLCRLIPGIRTLISIPAGFSHMPVGVFSLYTAIGTVAWTAILTGIGWWLGNRYADLSGPLSWVSTGVVTAFVVWWLVRLSREAVKRRQTTSH